MIKHSKSKTSLFLMELIITILFFSVCAAVCMQLFVQTHLLGQKTRELNHAVATAQGCAEVMRGTDGSIDEILKFYPSAVSDNETFLEVYYDSDFKVCEYTDAAYVADITLKPNGAIQNMDINIVRMDDLEVIYSLNCTKYMIDPKG